VQLLESEDELREGQAELKAINDELKRRREDAQQREQAAEEQRKAEAADEAAEILAKSQSAAHERAKLEAAKLQKRPSCRVILELLSDAEGPMTAPQMLGNSMNISNASMYTQLNHMQSRGLVSVSTKENGKRPVKYWSITAAGEDVWQVLYNGDQSA